MKRSAVVAMSFPQYSLAERRLDLGVHIVGLALAAVGAPSLLILGIPRADAGDAAGLALYATGLVAMLVFSCAYHLSARAPRKEMLRRFDRAAIFVMIAGTYSPFALGTIAGASGMALFASVWLLALLGASLAFAMPRRGDRLALVVYLAMGWCVLIVIGPLAEAVSRHIIALLLVGGVIYTLGVALHLAHRLPYHNALWHACVLTAASCHFFAVLGTFSAVPA
jgi:hemolysin III